MDLTRTVHHVEAFTDPRLDACQRRSIREASLCLAVSDSTARDVAREFAVDAKLVTNGVDFDRFARAAPSRLATWGRTLSASGGPAILAVGGVEERKNTIQTLRAFARLRGDIPDARLWILGGATVLDHGLYRAAFDRELAWLPPAVRAAVTIIGVVGDEDVPAIYRLASVLAFPSLHEGFGLAALEGLAAGLPVVASRRPPLTEFLDESCAILVDPTSPGDIARGIVRALRRPDGARREVGERRARSALLVARRGAAPRALPRDSQRGIETKRDTGGHVMPEMRIFWFDGPTARSRLATRRRWSLGNISRWGRSYAVSGFVERSRTLPHDRRRARPREVREPYCSAALDQLPRRSRRGPPTTTRRRLSPWSAFELLAPAAASPSSGADRPVSR